MTTAAPRATDRSTINDNIAAPLTERAPHPPATLAWPPLMRCDVIDAPIDICCGVIAHLGRDGVALCPIAQIGERMLFLTALGSTDSCVASTTDLAADVALRGAVDRFPDYGIPPMGGDMASPPASAALSALRPAYIEHTGGTNVMNTAPATSSHEPDVQGTCNGCGSPHPCITRRRQLRAEYMDHPVEVLTARMTAEFEAAMRPITAEMYDRYVGWVRRPDVRPAVGADRSVFRVPVAVPARRRPLPRRDQW